MGLLYIQSGIRTHDAWFNFPVQVFNPKMHDDDEKSWGIKTKNQFVKKCASIFFKLRMECEFCYSRKPPWKLTCCQKDKDPFFSQRSIFISNDERPLLSSPDDTQNVVLKLFLYDNDFENYVQLAHHLVDNLKNFSSTTNQLIDKNNGP